MRANKLNFLILAAALMFIFSCKKQTEVFTADPLSDYMPLQAGKYITYRTDSTVFTNFGRNTEVHSYQEKLVVDAQIPDALGRPSWRIFRFVRDTAGTQSWVPSGSLFITPLTNTVEVIENNLRTVTLSLPVKQDNTWKGNRYLADRPYSSIYSFNNDVEIADWDYTYSGVGQSIILNGHTINDVVTVDARDESLNAPVTDVNVYGFLNYLENKYAKGIGLVYQQFIMWEYQPNTSGPGGGFKSGFGVKRSMIDHN